LRPTTRREIVTGPVGRIECAVDAPDLAANGAPRGAALIAHPHPLFGGTLDNKVAQTLARAFVDLGYETWRPNFRGVGQSEGKHDEGRGEVDDLEAVYKAMKRQPVVLAGFSFGAAMQAKLAQKVPFERIVLIGVAVVDREVPPVPAGTLVIHGEVDTTIPLGAVLDWARPQDLPVTVVPGADHFFHHKLQVLRDFIKASWQLAA
jgi:alpha/beta superfamily hydrolase